MLFENALKLRGARDFGTEIDAERMRKYVPIPLSVSLGELQVDRIGAHPFEVLSDRIFHQVRQKPWPMEVSDPVDLPANFTVRVGSLRPAPF